MNRDEVLRMLRGLSDPGRVSGMGRFGIAPARAWGVSVPDLRRIAKRIGKDHTLALEMWATGVHEARILASMIDEPGEVSGKQMDEWALEIDSWDLCDQCCGNLFDRTSLAYVKAVEWSGRGEEFVKRAGFVLMATLAVHDRGAPDGRFERFFPLIVQEASDGRKFVRKAVNWALRQIGKRSRSLNGRAVETAERIRGLDSPSARWIGSDALRELRAEKTRRRLLRQEGRRRPSRVCLPGPHRGIPEMMVRGRPDPCILPGGSDRERRRSMKISARNVLKGKVKRIEAGAVNSEVTVQLPGGAEVVSIITKASVERLGLAEGKDVCAVIKASNVMIAAE